MIIKDKIQIGPFDFKIEFVPNLMEDEKTLGATDFDKQLIQLDSSQSEQGIADAFYHELVHILFILMGYKGQKLLSHDETFITSFSFGWHQIMNQVIEWQK
jgi:hypothetical protein